jgi:hypothetical protein
MAVVQFIEEQLQRCERGGAMRGMSVQALINLVISMDLPELEVQAREEEEHEGEPSGPHTGRQE